MPADHAHVIEQHGVTVQFMLGAGDDPETVDNLDAHVYLPDGTHRYATFLTTDAINRILRKDAQTGETGGGRYFWCSDQVIVPRPGIPAMMAALDEMVQSGDIVHICGEIKED